MPERAVLTYVGFPGPPCLAKPGKWRNQSTRHKNLPNSIEWNREVAIVCLLSPCQKKRVQKLGWDWEMFHLTYQPA